MLTPGLAEFLLSCSRLTALWITYSFVQCKLSCSGCIPPSPPLSLFLPSHFTAKWGSKKRWLPHEQLVHTHTLDTYTKDACKHTVYAPYTHTCSWTVTHTLSLSASPRSWHIAASRLSTRLSGTLCHSPSLCGLSHYISFDIAPPLCQVHRMLHRLCVFLDWMPSRPEGSVSSSKKRRPVYHEVWGVTNWLYFCSISGVTFKCRGKAKWDINKNQMERCYLRRLPS